MSRAQIEDLNRRLDLAADTIRQQVEISDRLARLGGDLEKRFARFAKKLNDLVDCLAFSQKVITVLTARVEKVEQELQEIET